MQKLRKGDEVVVIAGRSKGQRGRILRMMLAEGKALVENVNMVHKAMRPNPNTNEAGGIIRQESPLALSNLMLYNPNSGKGERVRISTDGDNKKFRVFKDGTRIKG